MIPIPRAVWQRAARANARKMRAGLGFMSADHHRVRDLVVMELPRLGAPLAPETIAVALDLAPAAVTAILGDLERHLLFLFRNERGEVSWAYPVTVDTTSHHAHFSTGEEAYAP